ncbi:MAG TPA: hypothetical protein VMW01_13980 [Williamwhitmania sp.]|nr:hypothetical protein [Williamwhitmania sp.]
MDKKTLDAIVVIILGTVLFLLIAIFFATPMLMDILRPSPPELYFPNQDENGFFPICIDGFMAGCTPKGCVPSEPIIECQIINVNLGELE